MAKAQEEGAELKPTPLPYEMELVEMKIKGKKFVKIMQGKEPSQVCVLVCAHVPVFHTDGGTGGWVGGSLLRRRVGWLWLRRLFLVSDVVVQFGTRVLVHSIARRNIPLVVCGRRGGGGCTSISGGFMRFFVVGFVANVHALGTPHLCVCVFYFNFNFYVYTTMKILCTIFTLPTTCAAYDTAGVDCFLQRVVQELHTRFFSWVVSCSLVPPVHVCAATTTVSYYNSSKVMSFFVHLSLVRSFHSSIRVVRTFCAYMCCVCMFFLVRVCVVYVYLCTGGAVLLGVHGRAGRPEGLPPVRPGVLQRGRCPSRRVQEDEPPLAAPQLLPGKLFGVWFWLW